MLERSSKRGLVWEGTKRMYVCEEVVDEEFESRERAYGFGVEDCVRGEGC